MEMDCLTQLRESRFIVLTGHKPKKRWNSLRLKVVLYDRLKDKILANAYPKVSNLLDKDTSEIVKTTLRFDRIKQNVLKKEKKT